MFWEGVIGGTIGVLLVATLWLYQWHKKSQKCCPGGRVVRGEGWRPGIGVGLQFIRNPTAYLQSLRQHYGDEQPLILEVFLFRLVFIFSPHGLKEFYGLPESQASFSAATRTLLGLKLPAETMDRGDIKQVRDLLRPSMMRTYVANAAQCCQRIFHPASFSDFVRTAVSSPLPPASGQTRAPAHVLDVFATFKKVIHEIGFRCWAGDFAADRYLSHFLRAFDTLDPENAFVDLASLVTTIVTRKRGELRALDELERIVRETLQALEQQQSPPATPHHETDSHAQQHGEGADENDDRSQPIVALFRKYQSENDPRPYRRVAVDIFILQVSSLANLYSAISWLVINLASHPDLCQQIRQQGQRIQSEFQTPQDQHRYPRSTEALAQWHLVDVTMYESLRLAQRSLTLRKVLQPFEIRTRENGPAFSIQPHGCYLSTLLSVTNTVFLPQNSISSSSSAHASSSSSSSAIGEQFDPNHYHENGKLRQELVEAQESVSTFGHRVHACPGRVFAMMISKLVLSYFLETVSDFSLLDPQPPSIPPSQIGAVGRTTNPVFIQFHFQE